MKVGSCHLSYCSNVHPADSWDETFAKLKQHTLAIAGKIAIAKPFGIGLRLSGRASEELLLHNNLKEFRQWLLNNNLYVFTINGFPYGEFHRKEVKDLVHKPDWTSQKRVNYTLRLARILAALLPEDTEGSISTSPVSYRLWFLRPEQNKVLVQGAENMALVASELYNIYLDTGKKVHIAIEPEPDGLIENSHELVLFFEKYLLKHGVKTLQKEGCSGRKAEEIIKDHIRVCFDVCHFALAYEEPRDTFRKLKSHGIKIGKVQISSALHIKLPQINERKQLLVDLKAFADPVYLHQVVVKNNRGKLEKYPDLPLAMEAIMDPEAEEWRVHFHVPVFTESYKRFGSTRKYILDTLCLCKKYRICDHLEVETYTRDVLPEDIRPDIDEMILKELQWVEKQLTGKKEKVNA
ncbi:metabolite traffic protein EboE [Cytophagaceae bacterium ABcell3]|nr:metabolite traffic protein EboE [Cytophagaceae bacterium ABcell3]